MESEGSPSPTPTEPEYHLVVVGLDGRAVATAAAGRGAFLAAARAAVAAGGASQVFAFEGRRIATTRPPMRAVFGPGDSAPIQQPPEPDEEPDDLGTVDPGSLGPLPASDAPAAPEKAAGAPGPAAPQGGGFDPFEDPDEDA